EPARERASRRESGKAGPRSAVAIEELALPALASRGSRGRQPAAGELALDHDELAPLAAHCVGPHETRRIVIIRCPRLVEELVHVSTDYAELREPRKALDSRLGVTIDISGRHIMTMGRRERDNDMMFEDGPRWFGGPRGMRGRGRGWR